MTDLDNQEIYKKLDPQGMLNHLHEMPAQCARAWQIAMDFNLPEGFSSINKIVILGMGGSAIGGDLVRSLVENEAIIPVLVNRDYTLPPFVDDQTLVIASSYSGMTEETLSAFEQALNTSAKKLAITTGGNLKEMAQGAGAPVFNIDYKSPPRAALPFSFLTILGILQKLSVIDSKAADVAETVDLLKKLSRIMSEDIPSAQNQAKQLAKRLYGRLPVIYGAGIVSEAAHRLKTQINENSKAWAFYEVLPELNHNAVVGYEFPQELSNKLLVVFLRSKLLHERVLLRYEITQELLKKADIECQTVDAEGKSKLSNLASLVLFGDYVSYYLALLYQIDPYPVKVIDYLKQRLSKAN